MTACGDRRAASVTSGTDNERVEQIRTAAATDVAAMTALAGIRREQYAQYQPLFWRPAVGALDKHRWPRPPCAALSRQWS
jgi:hypothetical protein